MESKTVIQADEALEYFHWPNKGQAVLYTKRSPAKETVNEDCALVAEVGSGRFVLAVADGLGGHAAGERASQEAVNALNESLKKQSGGSSIREAVLAGIDKANHAVQALSAGAGTTVAAVVVEDGKVRAYHVGDSHVIAFGGRGKLKLETIPHSPVGFGVEAGLIEPEQAIEHDERHVVSNVIGDQDMHIAISPIVPLALRDTVVAASDGLFDNMSVEEVIDRVRRGPLQKSVESLVAECSERMTQGGHPDDLTLIAFRQVRPAQE